MNTIYTERLQLEPLEERHAAPLFAKLSDRRLYEFISEEPPVSGLALRSRYARLASRKSDDGKQTWLNWAIKVRTDGQFVGYVQATLFDHQAEIAYVLAYDSWGKGYGREAVSGMLHHLTSEYAITAIRARVDPRNNRSVSLLEKAGFVKVAHRVGSEMIHGERADEAEYAMKISRTK